MKGKGIVKIALLLLMVGLFLDVVRAQGVGLCSGAFRETLGYARPGNWAAGKAGAVSGERLLGSEEWLSARRSVLATAEDKVAAERVLKRSEKSIIKIRQKYNKAHVKALNIKGQAVENLMDDFFAKDGWERLDGKRGRNGFDALYVRRNKKGDIVDYIVAEAKSGSSRLNMTKHGRQLSPEWVKHNKVELLRKAQQAYAAEPSPKNARSLADMKQINRLKGRTPRLFRATWTVEKGSPHLAVSQHSADGKMVSRTMKVDMTKSSRNRQMCMKAIRAAVREYLPKMKSTFMNPFWDALNRGQISDDASMHRVLADISRGRLPNISGRVKAEEKVWEKAIRQVFPKGREMASSSNHLTKVLIRVEKNIKTRSLLPASAGRAVVKSVGRKLGTTIAKRAGVVLGKGVLKRIAVSGAAGAVVGPVGAVAGTVVGVVWTAWDVGTLMWDYWKMKAEAEAERERIRLATKEIVDAIKRDHKKRMDEKNNLESSMNKYKTRRAELFTKLNLAK